ncbi:hypothetical protein LNTAR_13407 [Lentisphaera araneosa HTCC2155]|uniref:Uncharacterized protein n=1 Tax=Lentisphaera araneosa HTCC2155 TaxID=313628 RepID=A6DU06_9BACT|nr:hypothetical protein [Lentisphaera araneosa]EDM24872.1 hypothetical protein LNTAR_13407 [Lentisphaera araneosa HTCC2155]
MKKEHKIITLGGILFALGAFIIPLAIIIPLFLQDSNDNQFKVPGSFQVQANEIGTYYLWNDHQTIFQGKSYNRSQDIPDGMKFLLKDAQSGESFTFVSDTSMSSTRGNHARNTIGYIDIVKPGKVDIEVSGGEDEERIFSFSQSNFKTLFGIIFGGMALSLLVGVTGFVFIIWGIVLIVQSKNQDSENAPKKTFKEA